MAKREASVSWRLGTRGRPTTGRGAAFAGRVAPAPRRGARRSRQSPIGIIPDQFGSRERTQGKAGRGARPPWHRHGLTRSSGRHLLRADPAAHGAPQDPQEGPSLASRSAAAGWQASQAAELPEPYRRGPLSRAHIEVGAQEIVSTGGVNPPDFGSGG